MKQSEIRIPIRISGLPEGVHEFDLAARPEQIDLPAEFQEDLGLHVHLDKTRNQVILRIGLRSSAVYPCDRCLEPVVIPVEQNFTLLYAHDSADAKQFDDEETRIVDPSAPLIDIGDDVREIALLAIPMRRTCGEDEHGAPLCKDQETAARALAEERMPDTRWAALEKLKEQHENM